jgi:hypothetical protein
VNVADIPESGWMDLGMILAECVLNPGKEKHENLGFHEEFSLSILALIYTLTKNVTTRSPEFH